MKTGMTKIEKQLAAKGLRHIAERLINGERRYNHDGKRIPNGLCGLALHWLSFSAYDSVTKAIRPHVDDACSYLCKPGTKYNQRAMFALLLAESLEELR